MAILGRPERGDDIDEQQSGVGGRVDPRSARGQVGEHTGRGLPVHDQHRGESVGTIGAECRLDLRRVDPAAPVSGHELHVEAESAGDLRPGASEVTGVEGQHASAGRERVHQRGLPTARARAGEHHHGLVGDEQDAHAALE